MARRLRTGQVAKAAGVNVETLRYDELASVETCGATSCRVYENGKAPTDAQGSALLIAQGPIDG